MGCPCRVQGQVTISFLPVHTFPNFSLLQHFITTSHHLPRLPSLPTFPIHPTMFCPGAASAGQDPAIIEHVQGSASLTGAWHFPPGTYWLPTKEAPARGEKVTSLSLHRETSSPHSSDIPPIPRSAGVCSLTVAGDHFPWWRLPATASASDAARLGSSAPASTTLPTPVPVPTLRPHTPSLARAQSPLPLIMPPENYADIRICLSVLIQDKAS